MPLRTPPAPILTTRARNMRKEPTDAERLLWKHLRNRQFLGLKFKRQAPLGNYIADLFCEEQKVIVEADGGQHGDNSYDAKRDAWLKSQGYWVFRFWNHEILLDIESVLATLERDLGLVYRAK